LQLDSPPATLDAVIVTFNLVLTIGAPSLKPGTFTLQPMITVILPPASNSGIVQAGVTCKGPTAATQNSQPSVRLGSFAYPSSANFSAVVSSFSSNAFASVLEHDVSGDFDSSVTSQLLINVTGTSTSTPPASSGTAPILISILL
jgi:hypothetical protein